MNNITKFVEIKNELNPVIWNGKKIKKDVKLRLLQLAQDFYDSLDIKAKIIDIVFTGSLANYNYYETSDIDVHVLINYEDLGDYKLVKDLMMAKRRLWNLHHDVTIKGYDVELFVEDKDDIHKVKGKGVYSLLDDKWIRRPNKKYAENIDKEKIKTKYYKLVKEINSALKSRDFTRIELIKSKIKQMRTDSLDGIGEYSVGNMVFKLLRMNGHLEKLSKESSLIYDKKMKLESVSI